MTWRIDIQQGSRDQTVCFQGSLEQEALLELAALCEVAQQSGLQVDLWLMHGATADMAGIAALRNLPFARIQAESPALAHWLASIPSPE